MGVNKKDKRLGEEKYNKQGCLMKIIDYIDCYHIIVEFQDKFKYQVNTQYSYFKNGVVTNPYAQTVYNHGMLGINHSKKDTKEYSAWSGILERCYSEDLLKRRPTYKDAICCDEWLLFDNFYKWLHSQENYIKWRDGDKWAIDKDILTKGNKLYSPETCCLVPRRVNTLFTKTDSHRGEYPIGVYYKKERGMFCAQVSKVKTDGSKQQEHIGYYPTPEDAFYLGYKPAKEKYIKQIAQEEYNNGNITQKCYEAMMAYEVEITD